jgi:hypothetical protein
MFNFINVYIQERLGIKMYLIGDKVSVILTGTIERIEGGYSDEKIRYFIKGKHCESAVVCEDKIQSEILTDKEGV